MRVLRRVVTILLLVLLVSPFRAESQPAQKTSTIGILAMEAWPPIESLRQGLRDLGHIEGQNVRFEHRYAEGRNQRFRALAEDLVATKVDVMVTWGAEELDTALEAVSRERPQAVLVIGDPFLSLQRRRLAQFALKARLPSAYTYREHAEAEGLLAYTPNDPDCSGAPPATWTKF